MLCNFPRLVFSVLCFLRAGWKVRVGPTALGNIRACDIHCSLQTLTVFSAATMGKAVEKQEFLANSCSISLNVCHCPERKEVKRNPKGGPVVPRPPENPIGLKTQTPVVFWRTSNSKLLRLLTNANSATNLPLFLHLRSPSGSAPSSLAWLQLSFWCGCQASWYF